MGAVPAGVNRLSLCNLVPLAQTGFCCPRARLSPAPSLAQCQSEHVGKWGGNVVWTMACWGGGVRVKEHSACLFTLVYLLASHMLVPVPQTRTCGRAGVSSREQRE